MKTLRICAGCVLLAAALLSGCGARAEISAPAPAEPETQAASAPTEPETQEAAAPTEPEMPEPETAEPSAEPPAEPETTQPAWGPLVLASLQHTYDGLIQYRYDEDGRLAEEYHVDRGWSYLYTYQENGNINTWSIFHDMELVGLVQYDFYGNQVLRIYYEDGVETNRVQLLREYDDQGRLLRCSTQGPLSAEEMLYTYREDGSMTVEYTEYLRQELYHHRIGDFSPEGRLLRYNELVWMGQQSQYNWQLILDERGYPRNMVEEVQRPLEGGVYVRDIAEYVNTYDDQGRILKIQKYREAMEGPDYQEPRALVEETEYAYDASGRLVRQACTYLQHPWKSWERLWEYDADGNLLYHKGYDLLSDLESFTPSNYNPSGYEAFYTYLPLSEALYMG